MELIYRIDLPPKLVQGAFRLDVEEGEFTDSEIIVMLGENGTGKTTFIRMLHGSLKPDDEDTDVPEFRVSYKPQKISPKFPGTVSGAPPLYDLITALHNSVSVFAHRSRLLHMWPLVAVLADVSNKERE